MELIPILSFIILVATISTFILAVGAYVLYKIRESKGRLVVAPKPRAVQAELYSPAQVAVKQQEIPLQQKQVGQQYQNVPSEMQGRPVYVQSQQYIMQQNQMRPNPQRGVAQQDSQIPYQQNEEENGTSTDKKFMKYTSEGYIPVSKTKAGDNLKWR